MNNKIKLFVFFSFFITTISNAQNPGDFDNPTDSNPVDVPIDQFIWVFIILGLLYGFLIHFRLQKNNN